MYRVFGGQIYDIDGWMQERRNSIANALELRLSCTNPSMLCNPQLHDVHTVVAQFGIKPLCKPLMNSLNGLGEFNVHLKIMFFNMQVKQKVLFLNDLSSGDADIYHK